MKSRKPRKPRTTRKLSKLEVWYWLAVFYMQLATLFKLFWAWDILEFLVLSRTSISLLTHTYLFFSNLFPFFYLFYSDFLTFLLTFCLSIFISIFYLLFLLFVFLVDVSFLSNLPLAYYHTLTMHSQLSLTFGPSLSLQMTSF